MSEKVKFEIRVRALISNHLSCYINYLSTPQTFEMVCRQCKLSGGKVYFYAERIERGS